MSFTKITSADLADKGVVGLPDTPNLSVTALQKKFDEIATDVIVPKFNNLVDELDAFEESADIDERVKSATITNIKLDSDKKLQVSMDDGETWQSAGSSGHIIMNGAGASFEPRNRLQFSANTVVTDMPDDSVTFVQIPSGIKGDKGDAATIVVDSTTTLAAGEEAYVENVGSAKDAIFRFGIPSGTSGDAASVTVGTTTTIGSGENAYVSNRGTTSNVILDFYIPKGQQGEDGSSFRVLDSFETLEELYEAHPVGTSGAAYLVGTADDNTVYLWSPTENDYVDVGALKGDKGDPGIAATVSVGTVTDVGTEGTPFVTATGTASATVLNFGLKSGAKGDEGQAATISVGTVTRGENASVVNSGTTSNAVFDFVLPKGDKGDSGEPTVINGKSGETVVLYGADIFNQNYATRTYTPIVTTDSLTDCIKKLDGRVLQRANVTVSEWEDDSTYDDYSYKATITMSGVTSDYIPNVTFGVEQATSGEYAPIAETGSGVVYIWSSSDDEIVIPSIVCTRGASV